MSSYQKHILFSIIIALPFIHDIFYLSLAVIGASMIDIDHHLRKKNLIILVVSGILMTIILYFLKLPFLVGLSLITASIIFYVSKHRGFVHSILGILTLSILFTFVVLGFYNLSNGFNINLKTFLVIVSVILGIIILNKKIVIPFCILVIIGIIFNSNMSLNIIYVFFAFLIGGFSHIVLDLFTSSGIRLFDPISSRKYKKIAGINLFMLWVICVFLYNFSFNNLIF